MPLKNFIRVFTLIHQTLIFLKDEFGKSSFFASFNQRNISVLIVLLIYFYTLSTCVNHRYSITSPEKPKSKEMIQFSLFTIGGLVPIFNNLDKDNVCPNSKIRSINMHDSVINTTICTVSLFLICPHTVGIVCE